MKKQIKRGIPVWRFVHKDLSLRYGDPRKVEQGKTLSVRKPIAACNRGFHGCRFFTDALGYGALFNKERLSAATLSGQIDDVGEKIAGQHCRTDRVLSKDETTDFLYRWFLWCMKRLTRRKINRNEAVTKAIEHLEEVVRTGGVIDWRFFKFFRLMSYTSEQDPYHISTLGRAVWYSPDLDNIDRAVDQITTAITDTKEQEQKERHAQNAYANDLWTKMFE
jgi:hypothetical protein